VGEKREACVRGQSNRRSLGWPAKPIFGPGETGAAAGVAKVNGQSAPGWHRKRPRGFFCDAGKARHEESHPTEREQQAVGFRINHFYSFYTSHSRFTHPWMSAFFAVEAV